MSKSWDKQKNLQQFCNQWAIQCLRVLKPGGYLLSFGGTRTYHRMVCGIEDAGFEIRDTIMWIYGSGFPKSLNIGKAVDKLQGNEREVKKHHIQSQTNPEIHAGGSVHITMPNNWKVTKGTSEWEGWGTALKPAVEPIVVARKPLKEKTVAKNVLKYGTGGINIDESRIGTEDNLGRPVGKGDKEDKIYGKYKAPRGTRYGDEQKGRFPANIILDQEAAKILDEQSGERCGQLAPTTGKEPSALKKNQIYGDYSMVAGKPSQPRGLGCASRFFYIPKASRAERNKGCEGLEEKQQWLKGGTGTGISARENVVNQNNHPTVKPIKLLEYLIRMVTPKGGVVLDPFLGSGTTAIAAKKLGYKYIGIEKEEEYIKIAKARIKAQQTPLL